MSYYNDDEAYNYRLRHSYYNDDDAYNVINDMDLKEEPYTGKYKRDNIENSKSTKKVTFKRNRSHTIVHILETLLFLFFMTDLLLVTIYGFTIGINNMYLFIMAIISEALLVSLLTLYILYKKKN